MHNLNKDYSLPSQSDGIDIHTTDELFISRGRSVSAINGAGWVDKAIKIVIQQPKTWLIIMVIFIGIDFASTFIIETSPSLILPISIAMQLVYTMLFAGIILIAESQRLTATADLNQLGNGFSHRTAGIIALLCTQLLIGFMIALMMFLIIGLDSIEYIEQLSYAAQLDDDKLIMQALSSMGVGNILFAFLLGFVGLIMIQMLTCFAIPLMFIQQVPFWQSLSMSFSASTKNILPAIVYFICMIFIGIIALILIFIFNMNYSTSILSAILTVPFSYLATYTAYRDIFTNQV